MKPLFRRRGRPRARLAATAVLALGLAALALQLSSTASASSPSCADAVTSAPTGPATVSTASTAYGTVLVIGSGDYTGCSLYLLTSDQLHTLTSGAEPYACSDNLNPLGPTNPCDSVLWPALLTDGAPVAGPGVKQSLLGTVTRFDLPGLGPVQQVTYAGMPLYRFFLDETPGETEGADLFDPVTSPTGIWYLVEPKRGNPAPGQAQLQMETAPVDGTGPDATVLAATMNDDFSAFPDVSFPVYTLSPSHGGGRYESAARRGAGDVWYTVTSARRHGGRASAASGDAAGACREICAAVPWPPVLTSGKPEAGPGVDPHALGFVVRPDGTHQVTYHGKPLYLFYEDAYIGPLSIGTEGIFGAGESTPWGVFDTIPPSS